MKGSASPPRNWWQASNRTSARQLARRLAPSIGLVPGPVARLERVYLDTVDWRLFRHGEVLVDEDDKAASHSLVSQSRHTDRSDLVVHTSMRPRTAADLPGGLGPRLTPVLGARPLVEVAHEHAEVWPLRMVDADGKTVARLDVERVESHDAGAIVRVHLRSVRGYTGVARRMRAALDAQADLVATDEPIVFAGRAAGVEPGNDRRPAPLRLERSGRAVDALAAVLLHQLDTLIACEAGVRRGLDPEMLHDFRIAVRRTRSVVRLARSHLSRDLAKVWETEWDWLATITSTSRDLDVLLEEIDAARLALPAEAKRGLDEIEELVQERRTDAQSTLSAALAGDRYGTLKRGWRVGIAELAANESEGLTTEALADELVARAMRQLQQRAAAVTVDSTADVIHDVRKRTKRLRYTLELFDSALNRKTAKTYQRATKRLQDHLGAFQDNVVYHRRVTQLLDESPQLAPEAVAVARQLMTVFDERNTAARVELPEHVQRFVEEMSATSHRRR